MIERKHAGGCVVATAVSVLMLISSGCNKGPGASGNSPPVASEAPAGQASAEPATEVPFAWPASLRPFGDGYPQAGDPCRRLGETSAVVNYLDHTRDLVGCPGPADSAEARAILATGKALVVDQIDGVTLLSIQSR